MTAIVRQLANVMMVTALFCATGAACTAAEVPRASLNRAAMVGFMLTDAKYHSAADPVEAARRLRQDAKLAGYSLQVHALSFRPFLEGSEDSIAVPGLLRLFVRSIRNNEFKSALSELRSAPDSLRLRNAIFVSRQPLCIEDAARMLESGIRILDRGSWSIFIIAGNAQSLYELANWPECKWIGEVTQEMKLDTDDMGSTNAANYMCELYFPVKCEYVDDLRALQINASISDGNYVFFWGPSSLAKAVADLWFVAHVSQFSSAPIDGPKKSEDPVDAASRVDLTGF